MGAKLGGGDGDSNADKDDAPSAIARGGGGVAASDEASLAKMLLPDGATIPSGLEPSPPETRGGAGAAAKPRAAGASARSTKTLVDR